MTEERNTAARILAMTLVKLSETSADSAYIEQLKNTANAVCEFEKKESDECNLSESIDFLVDHYEEADELEPNYYDVEDTIDQVFKMCDTLTDAKEIMSHMRIARDLRFTWYPFPGEVSR